MDLLLYSFSIVSYRIVLLTLQYAQPPTYYIYCIDRPPYWASSLDFGVLGLLWLFLVYLMNIRDYVKKMRFHLQFLK